MRIEGASSACQKPDAMVRILRSQTRRLHEGFPQWARLPLEIQDQITEHYLQAILDDRAKPWAPEWCPWSRTWRETIVSSDIDYVVSLLAPANHFFKLHQVSRELAFRVHLACIRMMGNQYGSALPRSSPSSTDNHIWNGECSDRVRLQLLSMFIAHCKPLDVECRLAEDWTQGCGARHFAFALPGTRPPCMWCYEATMTDEPASENTSQHGQSE